MEMITLPSLSSLLVAIASLEVSHGRGRVLLFPHYRSRLRFKYSIKSSFELISIVSPRPELCVRHYILTIKCCLSCLPLHFQLAVIGSSFRVFPPASSGFQGRAFCSPHVVNPRTAPGCRPRRGPLVLWSHEYHARSLRAADAPGEDLAGREDDIQFEVRRLMSVPAIDIKLELQTLGIEHRDAFEKADLAKRLAEARTAKSVPAKSKGIGSAKPEIGYDSTGEFISRQDQAQGSSTWVGASAVGSKGASWSSAGPVPGVAGLEDQDSEAKRYSRDYARAMRMGKPAVIKELNALGVAHSRLSELEVLARQYSSGRREARRAAAEAERYDHSRPRTPAPGGEVAPEAPGRAEALRRARAVEISSPSQASDDEIASLLANAEGMSCTPDEGSDQQEGDSGDNDNTSAGDWWTSGQGWGASIAWPGRRDDEKIAGDGDEDDRDGEEESSSRYIWSNQPDRRATGDSPGGRPVVGQAESEPLSGSGDGARAERIMAPLQARAGRMSSRELMNALDSLGLYHGIPLARSELEEAFVKAVMGKQVHVPSVGEGDDEGGAAPLGPRVSRYERPAGLKPRMFGSYHAALQWARRLTSDDVLDELHYRGIEVDPTARYSDLTRVLAEEVIAEEEAMEAGGDAGEHTTGKPHRSSL